VDWDKVGALIVSVFAAAAGLYAALRRTRREDRTADAGLTRAEREAAADLEQRQAVGLRREWEQFAKAREARHKVDIDRLDADLRRCQDQLAAVSRAEQECQQKAARQDERVTYQAEQIKALRAEGEATRRELADTRRLLAERGIREGSGEHRPVDRRVGQDPDYPGPMRRRDDTPEGGP
jgi:hypothetical protein